MHQVRRYRRQGEDQDWRRRRLGFHFGFVRYLPLFEQLGYFSLAKSDGDDAIFVNRGSILVFLSFLVSLSFGNGVAMQFLLE